MHPMINIATRAARSAGNILVRYFSHVDSLNVQTKGKNEFVSDVDRAAEQAILDVLRRAYPGHAILAEESGAQEGNDFQWVIDPLDGTTNYLHGVPQFAVSIGLLNRGVLEHGVIYDPIREEMYTASRGQGALLNDRRIRVTGRKSLEGALIGTGIPFRDTSTADAYFAILREMIKDTAGIRRPGSAALDLAYVAAGRFDGFWEFGLKPWDLAAGALLVKEAGGLVTDIGGGDKFVETGNIIAGNLKVHGAMKQLIKPHLTDRLKA